MVRRDCSLFLSCYHVSIGGTVKKCTHQSTATGTKMTFSVFVPPAGRLLPLCFIFL